MPNLPYKEVPRAFVNGTYPAAKTQNGSLWYDDLKTLYSYDMPIMWRTRFGVRLVRSSAESSSVTTSRHISAAHSAASNIGTRSRPIYRTVFADELLELDVKIDDIAKMSPDGLSINIVPKGNDDGDYTLVRITAGNLVNPGLVTGMDYDKDPPYYVHVQGTYSPNSADVVRNMLPKEWLPLALDAQVSWALGAWFIGVPEEQTKNFKEEDIERLADIGSTSVPARVARLHRPSGLVQGVVYDARGPQARGHVALRLGQDTGLLDETGWWRIVKPVYPPITSVRNAPVKWEVVK